MGTGMGNADGGKKFLFLYHSLQYVIGCEKVFPFLKMLK
jgi:hypothetical protein